MKKLKKKKENAIQVQAHGFNFHGESKVGPAATAPTHSHSHTSLKTQFCLFVCFAWHCRLPLSYFTFHNTPLLDLLLFPIHPLQFPFSFSLVRLLNSQSPLLLHRTAEAAQRRRFHHRSSWPCLPLIAGTLIKCRFIFFI